MNNRKTICKIVISMFTVLIFALLFTLIAKQCKQHFEVTRDETFTNNELENIIYNDGETTDTCIPDCTAVETKADEDFLETEDYSCQHSNIIATTNESTCVKRGIVTIICADCDITIEQNTLELKEHQFSDYKTTIPISKEHKGVEAKQCFVCGLIIERELVCNHEITICVSNTAPTCIVNGEEIYACDICGEVTEIKTLDKTECTYSDWAFTIIPTPLTDGLIQKHCYVCGHTQSRVYKIVMAGPNSIYIPHPSLNATIHIGDFTQSEVDQYDIVYSENAMDNGSQNPFILGHNYGGLKHLYKVEIGQHIYVSIDGNIEEYEVVVSEYGITNISNTDIIGQTTGHSIFDSVGEKTLHMYTCYGLNNGRWIVLAKKVQKA